MLLSCLNRSVVGGRAAAWRKKEQPYPQEEEEEEGGRRKRYYFLTLINLYLFICVAHLFPDDSDTSSVGAEVVYGAEGSRSYFGAIVFQQANHRVNYSTV